jgi:hypothetical protein
MTVHETTVALLCTIVFSLVGLFHIVRLVTDHAWTDRVDAGAHVAMSVVMLAMPWSWYSAFPANAQICAFTAAALWYVWLALFEPAAASLGVGHHSGGIRLTYHAVMMAAMAWMAVAMTPMTPADSTTSGTSMSMTMSMPSDHGAMSHAGLAMTADQSWARPVGIALGLFFAVAAVVSVAVLARRLVQGDSFTGETRRATFDDLAAAGMSAGMSAAFLALMT